jgi:hypothetical protein
MNTEPTVRSELKLLPIILTVVLVGMGAAVAGFYSLPMLALFFGAAPVGLMLLWMTRDVAAPEDRIAAVDLQHKRQQPVAEAPREISRAA